MFYYLFRFNNYNYTCIKKFAIIYIKKYSQLKVYTLQNIGNKENVWIHEQGTFRFLKYNIGSLTFLLFLR